MRDQRKYDKEFRINAVKHYVDSEKSVEEVAKELDVPISILQGT